MEVVLVSRHKATKEWLVKNYPEMTVVQVISGNAVEEDVKGKVVCGNLPLSLAVGCSRYFAIEFAGAPPRGQEYGVAEMEASSARLQEYIVRRA